MADLSLSAAELRAAVSDDVRVQRDPFGLLQNVTWLVGSGQIDDERLARELVIRLLERREMLNGHREVLDALVRELGLFPYLDPQQLSVADQIAYEIHRPLNMTDIDVVFHEAQAHVYRELLAGRNVILSAPTSFGKSLVIDALVASGKYQNIVIVVPTIALIDETRRRLSRFGSTYKLITHPAQAIGDRNLFVLTQERVVDTTLPNPELFVIDEFYKLDSRSDPDRGNLLNQAFYKLWKGGGQFYFLGPNIDAIPDNLPGSFEFTFIKTDYSTVVIDIERVDRSVGDETALVELCRSIDEPTLIYCSSPARTRRVAQWLLDAGVSSEVPELLPASDWIAEEYHPEWLVGRALRNGIGIHHGRVPRALAHYMVRVFNEGAIRFLICTSTLIEGVNTKAKNVIVFDNRVARQNLDYFTFNNIRGRSGRMFEHFTGRVLLFHEPPPAAVTNVDLPALTQDDAPTSLLVQLDDEDLKPDARVKVEALVGQDDLAVDVLRANAGLDPDRQVVLAREIRGNARRLGPLLAWTGFPTSGELNAACQLIWDHLVTPGMRGQGALSANQLSFKINRLRALPGVKEQIRVEIENPRSQGADEAVEDALAFMRAWAGHNFPRLLLALDRIQRSVFESMGLRSGDFTLFAAAVENLFTPTPLVALDEFGIPLPTAIKLQGVLQPSGDLDDLLRRLAVLDLTRLRLTDFERQLIEDARSSF